MLAQARRITLDLGAVGDVAELKVNGRALPPLLMAPFDANVTRLVRPGRNRIDITVVNALSNAASSRRPVYPLVDQRMELAAAFVPHFGGLLGPVTMQITYR